MRLPPPAQSLPPRPRPPPLSTMLKSPTSTLSSPGTWKQNNGKTNQLLGRYSVVRPPSTPDTNVTSSSEMSYVDDEDAEVVHCPLFASSLDKQDNDNTALSSSGRDEIEKKWIRHSRQAAILNKDYNNNMTPKTLTISEEGIGNRQSRIVAAVAAAALERSYVATNKACATATTMTEENVVLVAENTVSATTTAAVSRGSLEKAAAQKSHTKAVNNGNSNNEDADTSTKTSINLLPRDIFGRIKFNVEKECVNVQHLEKKKEEVVKSNSIGEIPHLPLKSTTATIESTSNIAGVISQDCGKREALKQNLLIERKEGGNKRSGRLGVAVVTDASCITSVATPESRSFTVPNNERNRRGTQSSSLVTESNTTTIDNCQPRLEGDICSNPTTNTTISVESPVSSNPTTTTTIALESRSSSENSMVSDDPIVHSGWLRKKTKHGKWVRRYFILNATGTIHYSHSESESGKMIRLITGCARIERVKSIPTEFRVYSGSSSLMFSLTATLRARNVNDTICWVETIERISKHRRQQQQQQQHKSIVHVDINQETKSDNILSTMQDQSSNFIDNATELTSKIQMPVVVESLPPDVPITNDDDEPTIEADMTENVEKRDESAPIETLVTILNELIAFPTAHSLKIATIEDENDKKSNEPDPRAALIAMLNARSNLLSSRSETRSKAVENNSEPEHQENIMVDDVFPKLKDNSVYEKYYKMIKMGLPKEVAKHAMIRDKLDPSILDLDPDRPLKVQRTNSDEKQANITENATLIIKDDPRFSKYIKMLKIGLPIGAVRNAMQRDKIDPTVLDLDPEKSLESQQPPVLVPQIQDDPVVKADSPPKDNLNLAKYHKMLKMGLPVGAVLNALKRDGVDPALMNLDLPIGHVTNVNPLSSIRRKKVYWNQVDAKDGNMWSAVKKLDLKLKHHSSFEGLFTQAIDADKDKEASQSPNKSAKTVKVIDSKRGMNGDILLRKVKYSPLELSAMVEHLDCGRMDSHELRSLYEYLPTKEEIVRIRAYLMKSKSHNDAIADLTPTEQYMVVLLKVVDYEKKFLCLIFLSEFQIKMAELKYDVDQLRAACKELRTSKSFSELLAFILRLVNEINYGVEGCATVEGFTMDSLSKLSETKAFDNKTSVLEYLVKVIRQTNKDILKFQEEIKTVVIAKGVAIEHLLTSVKQLCVDCKTVSETATKHGDEYRKYAKDPTQKVKYRDVKSQRASVKELRQMITFIDEKGVPVGKIDTTHFERFALLAKLELQMAVDILREANQDYIALLQYFGEDVSIPAAVFFGMICQFMDAFDLASVMVEREEEMKLMEARRALAREAKLRVKSIARVLQQTDVGNPKHRMFSSTTNCYSVANENKVPSSGAEAAQNMRLNDMDTSVAQKRDREHISLYHARTNQSKQSGIAEQAVKSERSVKSNGSIRKTSTLSLAVAAAAQRSRASVPCNP